MSQSDAAFAETAKQVRSEFNQAADAPDDFNQDVSHDGPPSPVAPRIVRVPRVNQKVKHPDFGIGTVTEVEGSGDHAKVAIVFAGGLKKKLLLKYAPLEFVGSR
jgi:hypothetical protein